MEYFAVLSKWNAGVPKRVERGLHALSLPYGYETAGDGEPAQVIPERAALLRTWVDMFLAGKSYSDLCHYGDKIEPPKRGDKWQVCTVKRILKNPY